MRTAVGWVASIGMLLVVAASGAYAAPSVDGVISPADEWDGYFLGTSVVSDMAVDVYAGVEGDNLYVAYVADTSTGGWGAAEWLAMNATFQFRTPQSAVWPDPGFTSVAPAGPVAAQVVQSDGSSWVGVGSLAAAGVTCAYTTPSPWVSGDEVAELALPLDLVTYAGTDGSIELSGHYWQAAEAAPCYVALAPAEEPPAVIEVGIDVKPGSDPNPINLASKGVVPVAVLTTDAFDAASVVPELAVFEGALARKWSVCDVDADGDADLLMRFRVRDLWLEVGDTEAHLLGVTSDGVGIHGVEAVKVKEPKKGKSGK